MIAYLIGGPHDLTKMVIDHDLEFVRMPSLMSAPVAPCRGIEDHITATCKVHTYYRVTRQSGIGVFMHSSLLPGG